MELELQKFLRDGKTPQDVAAELAINVYEHPTLPLVGFKYDMIDSPKTHPIVRECRGVVLEKDTFNLVAKPFNRFFNAHEVQEEFAQFNWNNFTAYEKVDGSLAILYYYDNSWHMNTSGSFAQGNLPFQDFTWSQLFWQTISKGVSRTPFPTLTDKLDPDITYIFELCTIYNKIVRVYPEPTVFLLSAMNLKTLQEFADIETDALASTLGIPRPNNYKFTSFEAVTDFLFHKQREDPTYEGVIIRDDKNLRFKCKTETYLALHHMFDNGNVFNPNRLVPLMLNGESAELIATLTTTHPELVPHIEKVKNTLEEEWAKLSSVWDQHHSIEIQKDFALAIKDKTKFTGLLFANRKAKGDLKTLLRMWRENADGIVKTLF